MSRIRLILSGATACPHGFHAPELFQGVSPGLTSGCKMNPHYLVTAFRRRIGPRSSRRATEISESVGGLTRVLLRAADGTESQRAV
jgi:hypothetical protein